MEIDRLKHQHMQILDGISELRKLAHAGIKEHAQEIAKHITALSSVVKLHLAIEDRILYPALQSGNNTTLASMSKTYQDDMKGIASAYIAFSRHWGKADVVAQQPEQFRTEANLVLKTLFTRVRKENAEFYPAIEAL